MSSDQFDTVVVGGGVVGLATAAAFARRGHRVAVLDQHHIGAGSSYGNMGMITPSHAPPLTRPHTLRLIPRALFSPAAPVRVRLQARSAFWKWSLRFVAHCTQQHLTHAATVCGALLKSSRALFDDWAQALEVPFGWTTKGVMTVTADPHARAEYAQECEWLEPLGLCPVWVDRDALLEQFPVLNPQLRGGWLHADDAHLRPDDLLRALVRDCSRRDVQFGENTIVRGFADHGRQVLTSRGRLRAGRLVFATGAWSPALPTLRGLRIEAGKGYTLTAPATLALDRPLLLPDASAAITPFADCWRIGGTMEFAGLRPTLSQVRIDALRRAARAHLRQAPELERAEAWTGYRPMSADGIPYIGRLPDATHVWVAAGHSMLGVSMAPATARLLVELASDETPHIDPEPYALTR